MLTVRITGLKELEAKLGYKVLADPAMEEALDTISARFMRGGKGLGVKRNQLMLTSAPLLREVSSTLVPPRTTGSSWTGKNIAIFKAMAPRVVRAAVKRIRARWAE